MLKKPLLIGLAVVLAISTSPALLAVNAAVPADSVTYRLRLYHLHTGEHLDVVYRIGNQYLPDGIAELDHFLRDHRTGDVKDYDIREFDLLHDLLVKLGHPDNEIDIVCGYRTPWSNTYLRERSSGVALHSQHMEAKAIDIRIPGIQTALVRDAALALQRGGVGYYAQSDFVHVDVGPVRHW
ncbi:YcbK family protein [Telmatobacter bradus]|uniref:YcbK family protein n=1 Tax=Telmatobacter bradus TaxID=474953 RepID=UPI003B42A7F4